LSNQDHQPQVKRQSPYQLPVEMLAEFLHADFASGTLTWKLRERKHFTSARAQSSFNKNFVGKRALNAIHPDGYKTGILLGRAYLTHRVLLAMHIGYWPEYVDHINGNRADNRIENLREVTKVQNGRNTAMPTTNTSGHIGVSWNSRDKRWSAYITLNRKRKALGNFKELQAAIFCRKAAEIAYGFHPNHGRSV